MTAPKPDVSDDTVAKDTLLYQVVNLDRAEIFYGTTKTNLDETLGQVAKDPKGPGAGWQQGDKIFWRPLTDLLEASTAELLRREIESRQPPNQFKVIPWA